MSGGPATAAEWQAARNAARGKPVFVLCFVVLVWITGRAAMWKPSAETTAPTSLTQVVASSRGETAPAFAELVKPVPLVKNSPRGRPGKVGKSFAPAMPFPLFTSPLATPGGRALPSPYRPPANRTSGRVPMFTSGFQGIGLVAQLGRRLGEPVAARPGPAFALREGIRLRRDDLAHPRFSLDGWVLWREGMGQSVAAGAPSYGRSQAGAVLRYHLPHASRNAPQVHLRASAALAGGRERDAAIGLSARPLADVPVRLAIEGRVTQTRRDTQLRAGAYAVSEIAPFELPAGATGEVYLQGGYVTGEFATPFIDGHARATRELAELGDFRIDAGGGVWGGAQEGVQRFDVGPTASVRFPIGGGYARLSADYRVRVAGDAEPDSGPALTLATGF